MSKSALKSAHCPTIGLDEKFENRSATCFISALISSYIKVDKQRHEQEFKRESFSLSFHLTFANCAKFTPKYGTFWSFLVFSKTYLAQFGKFAFFRALWLCKRSLFGTMVFVIFLISRFCGCTSIVYKNPHHQI